MLRKLAASLLLAATLVSASLADLYPATMHIVKMDIANDIVYCSNWNGEIFSFYGCEDYMIGDVVSLIMNDNGTAEIYDDIIVDAQSSGYNF